MMELRDFVAETLKQVIDGVEAAQTYAKDKEGASIAPRAGTLHSDTVTLDAREVEFDVAVTQLEEAEAKAGIGVFFTAVGAGGQTQYGSSSSTANRIKFSVPVLFPYPSTEK